MIQTPPLVTFFVSVLMLLMEWWYLRDLVNRVIHYQGRRALRNRRKGQNFKEWFLYLRYRDMLPKLSLWIYFGGLLYMCIALLVALVFLISANQEGARIVLSVLLKVWLSKVAIDLLIQNGTIARSRTKNRVVRLIFYLDGKLEKRRKRK